MDQSANFPVSMSILTQLSEFLFFIELAGYQGGIFGLIMKNSVRTPHPSPQQAGNYGNVQFCLGITSRFLSIFRPDELEA